MFPARSLGFTSFVEIFAYVTVLYSIIEAVKYRLRGWRMLGVFCCLAVTRLGREHQSLSSPSYGIHAYSD